MSTSISTTAPVLTTTTTASLPGPVVNGTWPQVSAGNATTTTTNLVLAELTTPFVPPAQCTPVQNWTAATVQVAGDGFTKTTYSDIFLPVTDAQFSASIRLVSPISEYGNYSHDSLLLPEASAVQSVPRYQELMRRSGFTYTVFYDQFVEGISGTSCIKTIPLTSTTQSTATTAANGTSAATASTTGTASEPTTARASLAARNNTVPIITPGPTVITMFYQPWHIVWEKKDAASLSPSPPVVSVQNPVSTWEPGTEIDPKLTRKQSNPEAIDRSLGQIIGIVVGCVAAAFVGIFAVCLWLYIRSRRRRRQQFEREEHQLQEQRLQRIGEYQRSRSPADDEPLPVYVKSREHDRATVSAIAVPPYKERPNSENSRHSQQEDHNKEGRNSRHGIIEDSDGQTLHDQHAPENTTQQHGTHSQSDGNQRHE
ncbi:hypothetical protein PWT90_10673 [Aphanocladium album]|nr:hypothetical protein PWT90_10673 [Aphanocladium album]